MSRTSLLTQRELQVLALLARGYSRPDIAEALCVTSHTIKSHAGSVFAKIGAASKKEAADWYWENITLLG